MHGTGMQRQALLGASLRAAVDSVATGGEGVEAARLRGGVSERRRGRAAAARQRLGAFGNGGCRLVIIFWGAVSAATVRLQPCLPTRLKWVTPLAHKHRGAYTLDPCVLAPWDFHTFPHTHACAHPCRPGAPPPFHLILTSFPTHPPPRTHAPQAGGGDLTLGHLPKDQHQGALAALWGQKIAAASGVSCVDVSGGFADLFGCKDEQEVLNVKKAAFLAGKVGGGVGGSGEKDGGAWSEGVRSMNGVGASHCPIAM